jgi:hypothetical protein
MQIARRLKGERITNSVRISMMFEVMLQYASKCDSSSLSLIVRPGEEVTKSPK